MTDGIPVRTLVVLWVRTVSEHLQLFADMPVRTCAVPCVCTVSEHLKLFAGLKGVPSGEVDAAVKESISTVGLSEKVPAPTLHLVVAHTIR